MTRVLSLVLAVGLLLPASSSASLAASPPLPRAEPEEHDLAKRFQLYTSIAEANPSAATTTTTASLSLATAGSKKLLTPPAPRANLPKTLNYGVWENVEALKDPGRGNGDISVPQKGNFLGLSIELCVPPCLVVSLLLLLGRLTPPMLYSSSTTQVGRQSSL